MKYTIILIFITTLIIGSCHSKEETFKKAVEFYEIGKSYEENDLADSAANYYSKAYQLSKKSKSDSLTGIIGNSLGDILQIQDLYKNAIQVHTESYLYNNKLKDKTTASISLRAIGKDYLYNTNVNDSTYKTYKDSAFKYFTKAAKLIPQIKSQDEISTIYNNLCSYYTMSKQYEKALYYNAISIRFCRDSTKQYRNYSSRGNIYYILQQIDSAIYYCNRGIKSKDIYTRCTIHYKLANIYSLLGSSDSAKHMKIANSLHDSIESNTCGEEILQAIHNSKLKLLKHQKEKSAILIITIILIICCSGFFIYRKYYHKRFNTQQKELDSKQELTQKLKRELQESKQIENYTEIKERKELEEEKIIEHLIVLEKECSERFKKTSIYYKEINNKMDLTNKERELLSQAILIKFKPYIKEMNAYVQIAEEDYLVCCLSLIGFSTKQCSICRGVGEAVIRVQRKRIKEKLKTFFHSQKLCNSIFGKN